jgi:hypothetical protein
MLGRKKIPLLVGNVLNCVVNENIKLQVDPYQPNPFYNPKRSQTKKSKRKK